jgi:hypothetical protein
VQAIPFLESTNGFTYTAEGFCFIDYYDDAISTVFLLMLVGSLSAVWTLAFKTRSALGTAAVADAELQFGCVTRRSTCGRMRLLRAPPPPPRGGGGGLCIFIVCVCDDDFVVDAGRWHHHC